VLTILVYLIALFAALVGGIVGVLIMAGLMFRFHSYTSANAFDYRMEPLDPGVTGGIQRALVSVGRAASAFVLSRAVLSFVGYRFTPAFVVAVVLSVTAFDLWCLVNPKSVAAAGRTDPEAEARAIAFPRTVLLALQVLPTIMVAWLFLRP
jgi:hypothetical protein